MLNTAALDQTLEEIIARWGIPGLGVGIVEGDEVCYARGFGVQNLDTGTPVTPESIFCVASITKCFVATAVLQLAEQGKVHLDAPMVQYLPYFTLDDARAAHITVRQLLSHTSGIPDLEEHEYDLLVAHPEYDDEALERLVRRLNRRKLDAAPGERFYYSNLGYDVLGDLIAKISGQTFEAYMQAHILRPAGMLDSTLTLADVAPEQLAVPHLRTLHMRVRPIYPYHRSDAPASFLHSTVIDMCHWGTTCLNRGAYAGQRLLSPASCELMWAPVTARGYPPLYEHMGLGWNLGHFEGLKTVSHGGMGFGWSDFFILLPEKNRAAIILGNEESPARSRIVQALLHTMLDMQPQAGSVSWMIPISQALSEGGIQAAYACYEHIKDTQTQAYSFDPDDLISLMIQLVSVDQTRLAMDILGLNLHVFPDHMPSYQNLADLYLRQDQPVQAEEVLLKALIIQPDNPAILKQLEQATRIETNFEL